MFLRVVLAAVSIAGLAIGQNPYTNDLRLPNGRVWQELTESGKMMYLVGVASGLNIAAARAAQDGKHTETLGRIMDGPKGFVLADYRNEFDKLFSEAENLPIDLLAAWMYVDLKLKGTETKDRLENILIFLRQDAARHVPN